MKPIISNLYIYVLLLACYLCCSCEKELEYRGDETHPLLVLNSICNVGDVLECTVMKSKFFLSDDRYVNELLVDAMVEYRVNEGEWAAMKVDDTQPTPSSFISEYVIKGGDVVELRVSHPDFETIAHAKQTAPAELKAELLTYDLDEKTGKLIINVSLPPYAGQDEELAEYVTIFSQCVVDALVHDPMGDEMLMTLHVNDFTISDPELIAAAQGTDNDSFFGGMGDLEDDPNKFYELTFLYNVIKKPREIAMEMDIDFGHISVKKLTVMDLFFVVSTMSHEKKLFLQSMADADASANGMFSEKVQVYNNIEGGVGIFLISNNKYYQVYRNENASDWGIYGD